MLCFAVAGNAIPVCRLSERVLSRAGIDARHGFELALPVFTLSFTGLAKRTKGFPIKASDKETTLLTPRIIRKPRVLDLGEADFKVGDALLHLGINASSPQGRFRLGLTRGLTPLAPEMARQLPGEFVGCLGVKKGVLLLARKTRALTRFGAV